MWVLPKELITNGKSFIVYTYMAEGSMLLPYLRKLRIPYDHETDPEADYKFRLAANELIEIRTIPALKEMTFAYTAQKRNTKKNGSKSKQCTKEP